MALDFRQRTVNIPSGTGRRSINDSVTFNSRVIRANVALNGFKLDFVNSDRHINIVEADTDLVSISGSTVNFSVECQYADRSVSSSDAYTGYITALIIAEVA